MKSIKSIIIYSFLFVINSSYAYEFFFRGNFVIDGYNYKSKIELINKNDKSYFLRIWPEDSTNYCDFTVFKITVPQQTRGRNGLIFSDYDKNCKFKIKSKEKNIFWNSVLLIDANYRFIISAKLDGELIVHTKDRRFFTTLTLE